jgi:trans-2,3-dihydro-3-hydroxyanthranilate isomerase
MFAPTFGISEDPATGSAVAGLTGVIMRFDTPPSGSHRFVIEQGFEMGRPSLIGLEIDVAGGRIEAARIGGDAVVIAEGTLAID